jgi:CRISPR-associated protein Cmr4
MPDQPSHIVGALLGLHAQTSLHPGAGTALGTVDLPVQRERHTHWPTIAGSALKGILRDACRERIAARDDLDELERFDDTPEKRADRGKQTRRERADATLLLNIIFGPPTAGSSEFGGAVSVTDARLLAFPVRSLKGIFAWVSCPAVLERLQRDAALARREVAWPIPKVEPNQAAVAAGDACACLIEKKQVVLEEFDFTRAGDDASSVATWVAETLLPRTPAYEATRRRFAQHFLVLHDDDFTHFARHATEVSARIGLNYETKTVKEGALFYQEFLPTETLLYAVVLANPARGRGGQKAADLLLFLHEQLPPVLQVGGDETTGKGYCAIHLWP